jgi:hypothetical protein
MKPAESREPIAEVDHRPSMLPERGYQSNLVRRFFLSK